MSNQIIRDNDTLLDILNLPTKGDPRKESVLIGLPNDIKNMFNNEETIFKHRTTPWQFWYNNSLSEFSSQQEEDYRTTLYALHYVPKIKWPERNVEYNIDSDNSTQNKVLKLVKEDFNKNLVSGSDTINDENPTLKMLFESEKANIAAITMQSDQKLNDFLLDFIVKLIIIVREGIILCKLIDDKCEVTNGADDYNLVELLNIGIVDVFCILLYNSKKSLNSGHVLYKSLSKFSSKFIINLILYFIYY